MRSLTARQWAGWRAYLKVFPLPHDRGDINTAYTRATIAACAGAKNVKPAKLIPQYGKVSRKRSESELKALAMSMVTRVAK